MGESDLVEGLLILAGIGDAAHEVNQDIQQQKAEEEDAKKKAEELGRGVEEQDILDQLPESQKTEEGKIKTPDNSGDTDGGGGGDVGINKPTAINIFDRISRSPVGDVGRTAGRIGRRVGRTISSPEFLGTSLLLGTGAQLLRGQSASGGTLPKLNTRGSGRAGANAAAEERRRRRGAGGRRATILGVPGPRLPRASLGTQTLSGRRTS